MEAGGGRRGWESLGSMALAGAEGAMRLPTVSRRRAELGRAGAHPARAQPQVSSDRWPVTGRCPGPAGHPSQPPTPCQPQGLEGRRG